MHGDPSGTEGLPLLDPGVDFVRADLDALHLAFGRDSAAKLGQFYLRHTRPQARGLGQFVVIEKTIFVGILLGDAWAPASEAISMGGIGALARDLPPQPETAAATARQTKPIARRCPNCFCI